MKISIITVCLNAEDTIEETILNIQNQTYKDIEHIIIDGNSADKTLEIINKHKEKIAVVVSEKDNGPYDAMNKGIKKATGDFIIFMNANDTFYENSVIEKVVEILKKNPERLVLFGDVNRICWDGKTSYLEKYGHIKDIFYFINNNICHQSIFYHKSLLENFDGYSKEYKIYADWDLNIKCFCKEKIPAVYLPITISNFLMGGMCTDSKYKKIYRKEIASLNKKHYSFLNPIIQFDKFLMNYFRSIYKLTPTRPIFKVLNRICASNKKYQLNIKTESI